MILKKSHPFFNATKDINEILLPLQKVGITYFTYTKTYNSGERIYLGTNEDMLNTYLNNKSYLVGNTEQRPSTYKSQILLWSTLPNQKVLDDNSRAYGYDHGIFIIEPSTDYNECFAFATNKGNDRIINQYLTNLDVFKKFTSYFKEQAAIPIKIAEKNKIILPFNENDIYSADQVPILIDDTVFLNSFNDQLIKLSHRQNQCCSLLILGKTSKEIASTLQLSVRTVEFYFDNIKKKMKCRNKTELIKAILKFTK